jgi:hypothetical protein
MRLTSLWVINVLTAFDKICSFFGTSKCSRLRDGSAALAQSFMVTVTEILRVIRAMSSPFQMPHSKECGTRYRRVDVIVVGSKPKLIGRVHRPGFTVSSFSLRSGCLTDSYAS